MKCCKSCKHIKKISCGEYYYSSCMKASTTHVDNNRIEGPQTIYHYKFCTEYVDLCDKEGYYEPNLIQKFKNFFTGE